MRPDDMTAADEEYASDVHRAKAIAKAHGYDSIADCAKQLYGWPGTSTLTPAEYIVARWKLARIDEYWAAIQGRARDVRQRDAIADAWQKQAAPLEALVGA